MDNMSCSSFVPGDSCLQKWVLPPSQDVDEMECEADAVHKPGYDERDPQPEVLLLAKLWSELDTHHNAEYSGDGEHVDGDPLGVAPKAAEVRQSLDISVHPLPIYVSQVQIVKQFLI